jgi:hypothetical protein
MKFDRQQFFTGFRNGFGALKQSQVDGLNKILDSAEADTDITALRWIAYIFATIKRECGDTWMPITERGGHSYFNKYEPGTRLGKMLGNTQRGDGFTFRGRGYPQTTGRANYQKLTDQFGVDFVTQPDLLLDPDWAWKGSTSYAMRVGLYTGRTLAQFIPEDESQPADYFNAREIINGHDHAQEIADNAVKFEAILRAALLAEQPTVA